MRRPRQTSPAILAVALLAVASLLAGCSDKAKSPTEASSSSSSSLAAATGESQGGGNGGHGHHGQPGGQLVFQIHPDVWNLQWMSSQGTVQAFVTGPNLSQIDPTSAQLAGDGTAAAIHPTWTKLVRHQFMARFSKQDAIGLFPNGKRGAKHTITLSFTQNGAAVQLTDSIRLVGPAGGSPSTDVGD